jgi:UDP-GlcNAc:undecaprenyl-phosphate GlcNAc-1-phosphate transferase
VLAVLIGRNAFAVGKALGVLDWPDSAGGRKLHNNVTPLVGGTAVVLSIFAATLLTLGYVSTRSIDVASHLGVVGLCVFAIYAIGLTDDRVALSARVRLAISAAVLLMAMVGDPSIVISSLDLGGVSIELGRFGLVFTLLCYVGLLNAVNMADGKNGLVITMSMIWLSVLLLHSPAYWVPAIVAGLAALGVTLWFNMRGRLFLGDGGSYGIGAFIALLTVSIHGGGNPGLAGVPLTPLQIVTMFLVPVLDTVRLMVARKLRGVSPFEGDRNHLHHHLWNRWGWPRGLVVYSALVGIPSVVTQMFPAAAPGAIVGMVAAYFWLLAVTRASLPVAREPAVAAVTEAAAPHHAAPLQREAADRAA